MREKGKEQGHLSWWDKGPPLYGEETAVVYRKMVIRQKGNPVLG